jgi:hypothetical protein
VPWRTWPDYADGCTVANAITDGDAATVTIAYTFAEYPEADYSNDLRLKALVVQQGFDPIWRIDDVDLGEGRTLRSMLTGAFAP